MRNLALAIRRKGLGIEIRQATVHVPLDVRDVRIVEDLLHLFPDAVDNFLAGEIKNELESGSYRISSGNLPLGIFQKPDMEAVSRTLMDGDYIIMVSDGVLDALSQGIGEDMLSELIGGSNLENPGEMANALLNFCIHQCRGHIRDDMTILVIGIWKKND